MCPITENGRLDSLYDTVLNQIGAFKAYSTTIKGAFE